jgi:spore germination protein GerM
MKLMKRITRVTAALIALLILAACTGTTEAPPTPTLIPTPQQAPSDTPAPTQTPEPSETPEADLSPSPATTNEPVGEPASGGPVIYLVALEDGGERGEEIGCGDSLVPVPVDVSPGVEPMQGVYEALLTETGQSERLYNALIQSDLQVDGYQVENGEAIVALSGEFQIGGACDVPRVRAQLEQTALQFEEVDSVEILINGDPLNAYLAGETDEEIGPQAAAAEVASVQIYLIALEDGGASGEEIGCGDSLVPVDVPIDPTPAPLEAAMKELLAVKDEFYGQSGLYNALHMSGLRFEEAIIYDDGTAVINLSGAVDFSGECDLPRFKGQLEATALQFSTVKRAAIFINGQPLDVITGQIDNEPERSTVDEAQLYFIAEGDDGASGRAVGCGDSSVPVTVQIEPTNRPIAAALDALLAVKDEHYGQSGLLNALAGDSLSVTSVDVGEDGTALVTLSGDFELAGTCDGPRVEAQLVDTVTQFDGVDDAVILINGRPLSDILDMR